MAAFGGEYARLRTDCRLVGRGASGNLVSLYFGDGHQMLDFRTFQDHAAPDTTSDLLFKGAVDDDSHSVYTGLIRVRPTARGTNAFQTNRNIKLSDRAWAESVPNLEIENNDVRCSHASTVGPIDDEQRFYLESRGVPPDGGRAADRERLLRRGDRPAAGAGRSAPPAPAGRGQARPPGSAVSAERGDGGMRHRVCGVDELSAARPVASTVGGRRIAVVRIDDDVYAIGDTCSHADVSLSEGEVLPTGARDRVLEARLDVLAASTVSPVPAGRPAGAGLPGRGRGRRRGGRGRPSTATTRRSEG